MIFLGDKFAIPAPHCICSKNIALLYFKRLGSSCQTRPKFGNCQLLKQRSKYNITERTHCVILFKNLPKKNHNHRPPFVVHSLTSSVNYCHNFQVQKLYLAPTLATYSKRMFDSVQILAKKLQATKGLCVALWLGGFDFW